MPAIATYPGTVTPLRGLNAFAESERDVLFGRDREREDIARLVIGEGFRAGLLHGEPGVGKTSLLRAGVIPHLRDHGVIALPCDDISNPVESFGQAVAAATGLARNDDESPVGFLGRVVAQALSGQLYLFILDDVDVILGAEDQRTEDLKELFSRVVTRSGGRARFLFSCNSAGVHLLSRLEERVGSLFPPQNRYELRRFPAAEAQAVMERTMALANVSADPQLPAALVAGLARTGPVLPADLQVAALAVRELGLTSAAQVNEVGVHELHRLWLLRAAEATGSEQSALRLLAELADTSQVVAGTMPFAVDWAARRASLPPTVARHTFAVLQEKGVVRAVSVPGAPETHFAISHETLVTRIREIAAPARATSRRAFELLGSKVSQGKRLSLREWIALRRDGIAPATAEEAGVVARTKRFFLIIAAAVAAIPFLFLIIIYMSMSGSYYFDVVSGKNGGADRVVVRAGKASLSAFNWMPASPSFGSIVADTGLTESMVDPDTWSKIKGNGITGSLDSGDFAKQTLNALRPRTRNLLRYATSGDTDALKELRSSVKRGDDIAAMLDALRPIARAGSDEEKMVQKLLGHDSTAVQTAALNVAAAVAKRRPGKYSAALVSALIAPNAELRRHAVDSIRRLDKKTGNALIRKALRRNPRETARKELLAEVSDDPTGTRPTTTSATQELARRVTPLRRKQLRTLLKRAFRTDPTGTSEALAKISGDSATPPVNRVLALEMLKERAPSKVYKKISRSIKQAHEAKDRSVSNAALPVYAKVAPNDAVVVLTRMLDSRESMSAERKIALAFGWGFIASSSRDPRAARAALDLLLKEKSLKVRAAAIRAYGYVGGATHVRLTKVMKSEGITMLGKAAAHAFANGAGRSPKGAVGGLYNFWKRKGGPRLVATRAFARMARIKRSRAVHYAVPYLVQAATDRSDTRLHRVAVEGLCNGVATGSSVAQRALVRAAGNKALAVRRLVVECAVDNPTLVRMASRIAARLVEDGDSSIRTQVALILTDVSKKGKGSGAVTRALNTMASDPDRSVRLIAIRALAALGKQKAPVSAKKKIVASFPRRDEREKLVLLEAARAMGAGEIVKVAAADDSARVRIAALQTAIATGTRVAETIKSAQNDADSAVRIAGLDAALKTKTNVTSAIDAALRDSAPSVRRNALGQLAVEKSKIPQEAIDRALVIAMRDTDSSIADLALTTLARLGGRKEVRRRLGNALAARSERTRAQAATACGGLVERDPKAAISLLEPLLDDPSHDVRVAVLPPLAAAYAKLNAAKELSDMLRGSEKHAMKRLVAAAAFLVLAKTKAGRKASIEALEDIAKSGKPLVKVIAALAQGLVQSKANGLAFIPRLAP